MLARGRTIIFGYYRTPYLSYSILILAPTKFIYALGKKQKLRIPFKRPLKQAPRNALALDCIHYYPPCSDEPSLIQQNKSIEASASQESLATMFTNSMASIVGQVVIIWLFYQTVSFFIKLYQVRSKFQRMQRDSLVSCPTSRA